MQSASLFKLGRLLPLPHSLSTLLMLTLACNNVMAAGALAIDEAKGDQYGWAVNFPTYQEAEQNALRECGEGCHIVMWVSDSCAAYAADQQENSTVFGWSRGFPSTDEARNRALAECRNRSDTGSQCVVRVWGCDTETSEPRSTPGGSGTALALSPAHPARAQASGLPAGVTVEDMCQQGEVATCWIELENQPGCYFWPSSALLRTEAATWSGACVDGLAEGNGSITGSFDGYDDVRISYTATGQIQRGKPHGQWAGDFYVDNSYSQWKGPFVEGKAHGVWIGRDDDGSVSEVPYVDDLIHGQLVTRYPNGIVSESTFVNGELTSVDGVALD